MASKSYNKAPPLLSECKNYEDWKKLMIIWKELTTLEKKKQGPALVFALDGKAQDAALELTSEEISSDDGVDKIITRLDKIFAKDKLTEKFDAIEKFESYQRTKENKMRDFLTEFDKRHYKIKTYITYPNDLLGYRLLKAANLDPSQERLIKATIADLTYDEVRTKLMKVFADESMKGDIDDSMHKMEIKSEPAFYTKDEYGEEELQSSSDEEGIYYVKRQPYRPSTRYVKQKPGNWRQDRERTGWNGTDASKFSNNKDRGKAKNPLDRNGRISRCAICESINHWQQECPDKQNDTLYTVHEIVLHNDNNYPDNLKNLVAETWNCGLLDCGASKTVCGEIWLNEYINSLTESQKKNIKHYHSKSLYRFGDGEQIQAIRGISIPAIIGNTNVQINTDVITKDLPLLLSKSFMKRADMIVDFQSDTAKALGETVQLATTSSGHYTIPLTRPKQIITSMGKQDECKFILVSKVSEDNEYIAKKLHRQFAHPSLNQILSLINKAGPPWNKNEELKTELKRIDQECSTCQIYRKSPARPVVGLPMATRFQETVAMDLKFYDKKIILHLIDLCTRLSAATTIKDKNPPTVVEGILKIWVSVYGSCEKFLVDNGGEFANQELISFAEQFDIYIKTTAAESPWSNGIVERHNLTLSNMLDKVLHETNCSFNTALYWCVNAKNSLYNKHGFTPYQLSIGTNPQLPSLMDDKPPALSGKPATQMIKENLQMLHKAREAFIQSEHSERIRRALAHNIRTSGEIKYITGDQVYYKRKDSNEWKGPGSVLGQDGQQILIKHGSYYVRVHPCRVKLVQSENQPEKNIVKEYLPSNHREEEHQTPSNITREYQESSEDSDNESINEPKSDVLPTQNALPIEEPEQAVSPTQDVSPTETVKPKEKQAQLKLKPNLHLKYKDNNDNWHNVKVISRAGKVGGKHDGWYNVETETGMKRAVDFSNIKNIEVNDNPSELTLITNTAEILAAKSRELESWKNQSVYMETPNNGQPCMSLRWVITPKVIDGKPSVKARLVARGFEEVQNFRTDSPTCSKEGLRIVLTIITANSWTLNSLDIKTAFLQGKEINREIFVQPSHEANTNNLWKLLKTVYGLADASRSWYLKLRSELINLGGKPIQLDQGIFIWVHESNLIGVIVSFVDDVIWAGNQIFLKIIEKLKIIFKTSSEHIQNFKYIGMELNQNDDSTIMISQNDFIEDLELITLEESRKQCPKEELVNEKERSDIRRMIGKLNWLACMSRPEISFTVSDISSRITTATLSDIKLINKTIKFIKSNKNSIMIPKLDLNNLTIKVYTDASFNNLDGGYSQGGEVIFLTDPSGKSSVICWSSNRIRRVVRSTLAAETLAFADGAESALYLAKMILEFLPNPAGITCYTDSRSLFETSGSTKSINDKRLRVEVSAIREMIQKNEITIEWIDGKHQISDVLTKKGASPFSLMNVLKSGNIYNN